MLTRLKVSGFKNLVDVDVRFGPFTCIAGANGTGKSNLFDAIRFLSALTNNKTLLEAAQSVRGEDGSTTDIRTLFHHVGDSYDSAMSFEAEMIIPGEGIDDLGQKAEASITFLRYKLALAYRINVDMPTLGSLELIHEELEHINIGDAAKQLSFPHSPSWRRSVIKGRRTSPFISTESRGNQRIIKLHQDRGGHGRPQSILAENLPRTVLSTVRTAESGTALLARREMESWRLLQLEPTALRQSDSFTQPPGLGTDGSHMAATLDYLARTYRPTNGSHDHHEGIKVYDQVATHLSDLIDDVYAIHVDRDERRQLLTLEVTDRNQTVYPARSLSDGTLRFLALAVLELDPQTRGVICLEEPENGIHPERIPAILRLLQDIAMDVEEPGGNENPLRQVVINTHSPAVVMQVPDDSLLVAETKEKVREGQRFKHAAFSWLPGTWRAKAEPTVHPVAKGKLLAYLNPVAQEPNKKSANKARQRVIDRADLQPLLLSDLSDQ